MRTENRVKFDLANPSEELLNQILFFQPILLFSKTSLDVTRCFVIFFIEWEC